jgi:hypothetical protein
MKTLSKIFVVGALISFLFVSCSLGEDELSLIGPDFSIGDMQDSWEATAAVFTTSDAGSQFDQASIVADGGSASMIIESTGRFVLTIAPVGRSSYTVTGNMFFEEETWFAILFDDYPDDYEYFGVELTATTLTILGGPNTAEYDFDDDGTSELASVHLEFVRS